MEHGHARSRGPKKTALGRIGLILLSLAALPIAGARPGRIKPPPGAVPATAESPATAQPAPQDPQDPPPLPQPTGKACTQGQDQSDCDPNHPGDAAGRRPGNTPGDAWYRDMAKQMFELQEALDPVIAWSSKEAPQMAYFAEWMQSLVQQYHELGFHPNNNPREHAHGRMTRGDFNYILVYWVQPVYYNVLYSASDYYRAHAGSPEISEYRRMLDPVMSNYHDLVRCNYGFNGNDKGALEDSEAYPVESSAGLGRAR
jgi:hypothetical protein